MKLKPYPEYKESGLPWAGSVPIHWQPNRLKNWVVINAYVLPENTDGDFQFAYVYIGSAGTGALVRKHGHVKVGTDANIIQVGE